MLASVPSLSPFMIFCPSSVCPVVQITRRDRKVRAKGRTIRISSVNR
jgi:hypothetical protein